jgi:hypothetical protein
MPVVGKEKRVVVQASKHAMPFLGQFSNLVHAIYTS